MSHDTKWKTMTNVEVLVERHGERADIVLNRPERRNAITRAMAERLRDAIADCARDTGVRSMVLRGAGGCFCSGMDLKAAGEDLSNEPLDAWIGVHVALYECQTPVVVALERFAINAGASLVFAGGLSVAGEGSFLQVSEIAMGVAAPMNQVWLHLRHSAAVADRVTFLGDRITAPELLRLGLVTEVVADDQVVARAQELADRIAGYPVGGRKALVAVSRRLRGVVDDPHAWFASMVGIR